MYEKLSKYLEGFNYKSLDIDDVWILKFGSIRFKDSSKNYLEDSTIDFTNTEITYRVDTHTELDDIIFNSFKENSNIFDLKYLDKDIHSQFYDDEEGFITTGNLLSLKVHIPTRFSRYDSNYFGEIVPIEKFNVMVSGSLFAAYAKVSDYPIKTFIGHEFRELFKNIIETSSKFDVPLFGPSPIHPDIYIIKIKDNSDDTSSKINYKIDNNDLFILIYNFDQEIETIISYIFIDISSVLFNFYKAMLAFTSLVNYRLEIKDRLNELSIKYLDFINTKVYHFFKNSKRIKECNNDITRLRIMLLKYDLKKLGYSSIKQKFIEILSDNKFLGGFEDYFIGSIKEIDRFPDSFKYIIEHFENELRASVNTRIIVLASILGGIIGSALTVLLTVLLA
ncbi:hypothetical protein [Lutibacter sp.]